MVSNRGRNLLNDVRQQSLDINARLGRHKHSLVGIQFERVLHLLERSFGICRGKIDLVDDRHQSQALREGQIKVCDGLRLHALASIHKQESCGGAVSNYSSESSDAGIIRTSSAASITPGNLGPKVDVARRVDQMQEIILPFVVVEHGTCLRLDGDASLALDVELIQDLSIASLLNGARQFKKTIAESAFAMVDVSHDAEVPESLNWDFGYSLLKL